MKTIACCIAALCLVVLLPANSTAQELPYKEGAVWDVTFVRTKPGMTNDYLTNLASVWRKELEEAKKQGLVLSYKILSGWAAHKDDWDLMLITEYKNMAALDGSAEKFEAIAAKVVGSQQTQKGGYVKRSEMRDIIGYKLLREIILK